jgi:hypothetical protein
VSDHFAWLIERGQARRQDPPIWWAGKAEFSRDPDNWTSDAWAAIRFPTRDAAATMVELLRLRREAIGDPVEHGFTVSARPADSDAALRLDADDLDSISLILAEFPTWFSDLEAKVDRIRAALSASAREPEGEPDAE